ncbi:MAG: type II toxin-antitoxin system HicB family antitoxin, partial [Candidatus Eremiobacterota bacterium]
MILEYIQAAMDNARYKNLEDGTWFADIPDFRGVWANGQSVEICRKELIEVLEEWIILKLKDKDFLPVLRDIDINIKEVEVI